MGVTIKFGKPLETLSDIAKQGLDDLFFFGHKIWGLDLLEEQPHREMANDLMDMYNDGGKNYLLNNVPRDCFKTTFGSICFGAWVQLNEIYKKKNYYYRIFYNGATKEKSWKLIQSLMNKFEYDDRLKILYGNLVGKKVGVGQFSGYDLSPKYTTGFISPVIDANFFCGSVASEQTGSHSDMNINDDLSEQNNSTTKGRREKVILSYKNSISILRKDDKGRQLMNCTAWHDNDVRGYIISNEQKLIDEKGDDASRWKLRIRAAIDDNGDYYFPSRLGPKELEYLKHEYGPYGFACQYMNDPESAGQLIMEDQIRFKDPKNFPELTNIRITVDPAAGEEEQDSGDFFWITVGGYDRWNTLYILDVRYSASWGVRGFIDELFQVALDYPDYKQLFIEDVHKAILEHAIGLESSNRNQPLRIRWACRKRSESKWTRWLLFQPRFYNSRIFFSSDIPLDSQAEIKEQLIRAGSSDRDDFLDTLADFELGVRMVSLEGEAQVEEVASAPVFAPRQNFIKYKMKSEYDPVTRRFKSIMIPLGENPEPFKFEDMMK